LIQSKGKSNIVYISSFWERGGQAPRLRERSPYLILATNWSQIRKALKIGLNFTNNLFLVLTLSIQQYILRNKEGGKTIVKISIRIFTNIFKND